MPENSSSGSQVDWGVVEGMVGTVFTGIGTIVSASNQNSTITTSAGESYTVTNDGLGGYQASGPLAGAGNGNGNGNGNGWGMGAIAPSTLMILAVAAVAVLALR